LGFGLTVLLVLFAAQLLAYHQAFRVRPASDDWPIINEINRGNHQGVGVFFTQSVIHIGYRPLKSLAIWAFGNLGGDSIAARVAWIRAMTMAGALFYAWVALLWLRAMPVGHAATVAGLAVMFFHPVLPQAVASIDSIDTLASSALLWLGAWCTYRWRDRLTIALPAALGCFFLGVGFKENLFALAPLAAIVLWLFRRQRRVGSATLAFLVLIAAAVPMILIRRHVIDTGLEAGEKMLLMTPRQLAQNVVIFATGLLFFGDSLWVFVHQSTVVLAMVAAACFIAFGAMIGGILRSLPVLPLRWLLFAVVGIALASFPTVLLYHVSEMYVPPMLLPFALLCGIAADGWWVGGSRAGRVGLVGLATVALVSSVWTIQDKVNGLVDCGVRAERQLRQVLDYVPPRTKNKSIMLLFDAHTLPDRRTYAVFRMGDEILLVHEVTPEWLRPGDGLKLQSRVVDDPRTFDQTGWDLVLLWDSSKQQFSVLKNGLS